MLVYSTLDEISWRRSYLTAMYVTRAYCMTYLDRHMFPRRTWFLPPCLWATLTCKDTDSHGQAKMKANLQFSPLRCSSALSCYYSDRRQHYGPFFTPFFLFSFSSFLLPRMTLLSHLFSSNLIIFLCVCSRIISMLSLTTLSSLWLIFCCLMPTGLRVPVAQT